MGLREQLELALEGLLSVIGSSQWTVPIAGVVLLMLLGLGFGRQLGVRKRAAAARTGRTGTGAPDTGLPDTGDSDSGDGYRTDDITPAIEDRMLPLGRWGFLALVVVVAAGLWLAAYATVRDKAVFLAAKEWQFQPFYIAAHLITLRLFVTLFTRNYRAGLAYLDAPADQALAGMHRILGPIGAACAALVAAPFCVSDFRYLNGPKYERLDAAAPLQAIDYLMWSIWTAEWFLNAFIWVILLGFLVRNVRTLSTYAFKAPIEVVLQEKHYRPFLTMSSQGATVVLGFGIMTVLYISYTGGAVTDYLGLAITAVLLVLGFLVPWLLLKRKVRQAVIDEQGRIQEGLIAVAVRQHTPRPASAQLSAPAPAAYDLETVARKLDYVVSHLRITHLERLHLRLGATEARAVAIRLLAPAATIAWQVSQNYKPVAEGLNRILQPLLARLSSLSG